MRREDGLQESLLTVAKLADFPPASHPFGSVPTRADAVELLIHVRETGCRC